MMSLDTVRKKIDNVDEKLVKLLNERTRYALEIGLSLIHISEPTRPY